MGRREVKRGGYFLRPDDRGASLIAVVVALVFVLTMAAIITEITTTNIRMREFEVSEKENFYGADGVMESLRREMAGIAVQEMEVSYREMLSLYGEVLSRYAEEGDGSQEFALMLQEEFRRIYMDNLVGRFRDRNKEDKVPGDEAEGESAVFRVGYYDENLIADLLGDNSSYFRVAEDDQVFTADYKEGLFTLKNLRIVYSDADSHGYETWITTDMVFDTPAFQFDDGSAKSFMNYALIADTKIVAATDDNSTVTGSVYAGADGIVSESGKKPVDFSGDNIVTRGDIVVNGSSVLTFGLDKGGFDGTTHIWARNIYIEGVSNLGSGGDAADGDINLEMKGEINIEDDLVLNGTNSSVKLYGSYSGYNFRENYSTEGAVKNRLGENPAVDSFYSSAIMINGNKCILDIRELDHLYLAGRAFISRGSKMVTDGNKDILLGESLSVRADQLAYLVSARYLKKNDAGEVMLSSDKTAAFSDDGILMFKDATNVDLKPYIENGLLVVVPYQYRNQVASSTIKDPIVQYYMYFTTGEAANEFFYNYWNEAVEERSGGERLAEYEEDYAAAVLLDNHKTILTLSGDLLYRNSMEGENRGFELDQVKIADSGWKVPVDDAFYVYWERSDMLARTYKSLQVDLAGVYTRVASGDVRFVDTVGNIDLEKKVDPLFDNLIDAGKIESFLDSALSNVSSWGVEDITTVAGSKAVRITGKNSDEVEWEIVLCDNKAGAAYTINGKLNGIVIATGGVDIVDEVNGMVISGESIRLTGSKVKVTGDADLVKEIFDAVKAREYGSQFAEIFRDYKLTDRDGVNSARIGDYLFYENWTKNEGTAPDNDGTVPEDGE